MNRSTFFGIEIAKTGIFMGQKGLDVTGHNISNVNTAGYTRQRLIQTAIDPVTVGTRLSQMLNGKVGGGTTVMVLDQVRDVFLDRQLRQQNSIYHDWSYRSQGLSYVENLFDEYVDGSMSEAIRSFFNSVSEFSKGGNSDPKLRSNMRQQAIAMTDTFNYVYDRLVDEYNGQNSSVSTVAERINSISDQIAELNVKIYRYELSGELANDLKDKRNLLLDELSGFVDMTYTVDANDKMTVKVAGEVLVHHDQANHIVISTYDPTNPAEAGMCPTYGDPKVKLTLGSTVLDTTTVRGGQLHARMNLRDNGTADTPGIPYFINQLNSVVKTIIEAFNEVHEEAYTYPDDINGLVSRTGVKFFKDYDPNTGAGGFGLSQDILDSYYNIAGSSEKIDLKGDSPQTGNQDKAVILAEMANDRKFYDLVQSLVMDLAVTKNHSDNMLDTQETLTLSLDTQRQSISGVSMDEEMTNLIKYQHAYAGASRVLTTMDEAIDIIINKMGLVGR